MKIGIVKTGNIGSSLILELLLDERADRKDIEVSVCTSGAKMAPADGKRVLDKIISENPDLIIYSTPNPSAPGPLKVIDALSGQKAIIIGDAPGIKVKDRLKEAGLGYVFIKADSMIGARREFLDPIEMAVFNSDILKVLSVTGAFRIVQEEIDRTIDAIKLGEDYLPGIVVNGEVAINRSGITNPYARAKAMAAYEMAEKVGEMNIRGCFVVKDPEKYVLLVASAHEMLHAAAMLADEVREMEKADDAVLRRSHLPDGTLVGKRCLLEKPSRPQ